MDSLELALGQPGKAVHGMSGSPGTARSGWFTLALFTMTAALAIQGAGPGNVTIRGKKQGGSTWRVAVTSHSSQAPGLGALWARGRLQHLSDAYAVGDHGDCRTLWPVRSRAGGKKGSTRPPALFPGPGFVDDRDRP